MTTGAQRASGFRTSERSHALAAPGDAGQGSDSQPARWLELMVAPAVGLTMLPVYAVLAARMGRKRAWLAGFPIYWTVWCLAVPTMILRPRGVARVFGRSRRDRVAAALAILPPFVAAAGGAMGGGTGSRQDAILLAGTGWGTGSAKNFAGAASMPRAIRTLGAALSGRRSGSPSGTWRRDRWATRDAGARSSSARPGSGLPTGPLPDGRDPSGGPSRLTRCPGSP